MHKQWTKQCRTGEPKSMQEFSKKELWFKENWMSTSKPQCWVTRNLNRQENNTQYQTYCQNDYKRDKKNLKKQLQI